MRSSVNGTLFHLRSFLSYHIGRSFTDHSLIVYKNDDPLVLLPAAEMDIDGTRQLVSHPGASFGGFVHRGISYSDADQMASLITEYCIQQDFHRIFIVPTPQIYYPEPDETLDYTLSRHGYETVEYYIASVIFLNRPWEKIQAEICHRKNRSQSYYEQIVERYNIHFEWQPDFAAYYPILLDNKLRHNTMPTHSLAELERLHELLPDSFQLLLMYSNDCLVGGTLNFVANPRAVIIFYNMMDHQYASLQPATLQVMETIRWAQEKGFNALDFGVSQEPMASDPLTPRPPLIRFKEELTGRGMIRKALAKSFV